MFVLNSTVALVIFDVLDVWATLWYEDPESDAIISTIFSSVAALYGIIGRKNDLKEMKYDNLGDDNSTSMAVSSVLLSDDSETGTSPEENKRSNYEAMV
jgi:hypothetical protein